LSRKQGENGVEVASRRESKTHIEPYNRGPISPRKQRKGEVEVALREESKTHMEPYNYGPSFAPKTG